jgi:transposase-like protein
MFAPSLINEMILKRANEILRKASAYFAQAELDRRGK